MFSFSGRSDQICKFQQSWLGCSEFNSAAFLTIFRHQCNSVPGSLNVEFLVAEALQPSHDCCEAPHLHRALHQVSPNQLPGIHCSHLIHTAQRILMSQFSLSQAAVSGRVLDQWQTLTRFKRIRWCMLFVVVISTRTEDCPKEPTVASLHMLKRYVHPNRLSYRVGQYPL